MVLSTRTAAVVLVVAAQLALVGYLRLRQPPVRAGLLAVPLPQVDSLEPAVVQQLRDAQRVVLEAETGSAGSEAKLAESYGSLGELYYAYGFLEPAQICYRNARQLAPSEFRWPHLLGYLYQQNGRLEDAVEPYTVALRLRQDDFPVHVYLGDVYLQLDRRAEARAAFQAAFGPFPAAALNGLGQLELLEGRFEEARRDFEEALKRLPGATRIHYSLAMAYRGLHRTEEMTFHLEQVGPVGVQVSDTILDHLHDRLRGERANLIQGQMAFQAGQFRAAVDAFARAVSAAPLSARSNVNLGLALAAAGESDRAVPQLVAALRLDAGNAAAHLTLGALLAGQNRHAEAVEHFRAVIASAPDNIDALRSASRSLLALHHEDEAIDSLLKLATLAPADEPSLIKLSMLLLERHRADEARRLLERADRLFPNRPLTAAALRGLHRRPAAN